MQTFLPYANFDKSAQCLDYRRLGKQRVECKQILNALCGNSGWKNHPAVKMWNGYENALKAYMNACIKEWVRRGYNNNMNLHNLDVHGTTIDMPPWIGDNRFHASHRSNLLRKDSAHYGQFGWTESSDLPYFWPTKEGYGSSSNGRTFV